MTEALPESASSAVYLHLAAARIKELHHLDQELAGCKSGKGGRCYQKLPRHMQRRALSSNPKRLPHRLRRRHLAEGEPPRLTKRPASKHRSRSRARPSRPTPDDPVTAAGSRVADYLHRQSQSDNSWLETHVWHAKRFHMDRRWGYVLPLRPTQKMYRPTLRAVGQRCVMQDVSFMCCVEVRGPALLPVFQACTSQSAHARLRSVWDGDTWHNFTLYQPHKSEQAAVCGVELQRLPHLLAHDGSEGQGEEESRVWLWVHPASYKDLLDLLGEMFALQGVAQSDCINTAEEDAGTAYEEEKENCEVMDVDDEARNNNEAKSVNLTDANVLFSSRGADCAVEGQNSIPKSKVKRKHHLLQARMARACVPDYVSKDKKVSVFCLKDTLNRFHLRGPEAYEILKSILVPSSVIPEPLEKESESRLNELPVGKPKDSSTEYSSQTSGKDPNQAMKSNNTSLASDQNHSIDGNNGNITEDQRDSSSWWQNYYAFPQQQAEQRTNALSWAEALCVQENSVLPLVVRDPRVLLPCKRAKIDQSRARPARRPLNMKNVCPHSPLYDPAVRRLLFKQRRADHEINSLRQHSGVPGAVLPLSSEEARLPVVLLLRHLRQSLGTPLPHDFCDVAFDVILPGGWGSNFWTALVYAGAVAVGVDSEVHFMREEQTPPPPYLLPDLPAGRRYEQIKARQLREEHFSMPPDKRPNFIKLGVQFPFSFPWSKLIASLRRQPSFNNAIEKEIGLGFSDEVLLQLGLPQAESKDADGNDNGEISYVLRNPQYLRVLDILSCRSGSRRRIFRGLDPVSEQMQNKLEDTHISESVSGNSPSLKEGLLITPLLQEDLTELLETMNLMKRTSQLHIVRVQITLIGKGSVEPMALICRPSASDMQHLKEILTNEQRPSLDVSAGLVEPSRPDENEEKRKQLKQEHEKDQTKLHRLRKTVRRRVRCNHQDGGGSLDEAINEALQRLECQQQELISRKESYASAMESLWLLPAEVPLQQCSRLIVGCVTDASFSRVRGCGVGQGFVAVGALLPICQQRLECWKSSSVRTSDDTDSQVPRKKLKLDDGSSVAGDASCVSAGGGDQVSAEKPDVNGEGLDSDLPFIQERGIAVLVRNKNSLQYRIVQLHLVANRGPLYREYLSEAERNNYSSREKRHTLKYGRCDPTLTFLGQGQQILHEMPIRREKFFIRPKSTFRRIVLQVRLDNIFFSNDPKLVDTSVEFLNTDLQKLKIDFNSWIEVTAEALKSKSFGPDNWKLRLTVQDKWKKEVEVRKWWRVYPFDSLVISGEGGAEWSFDCFPDDTLPFTGNHHSLEDLDLEDDSVWMIAFLVVGTIVFVMIISSLVVYCRRKERQQSGNVHGFFTMSKSFRLRSPKTKESIYEEIAMKKTAAFTLSDLRRLEGMPSQPPPLPQPNPSRGAVTAVTSPVSPSFSDVAEKDWYNSLEASKESGYQVPSKCESKPQPEQADAHQRVENAYSNCPRISIRNETYVDMRRLNTK
ncbi:Ribonuclease P/MRP subunit POP1 [Trinorchestia longiramus]|nr:Ribonuclease P/MRP subunit POP1 [Trinorchestia longiramus]